MPREKANKVGSGDVVALAFVLRDADNEALCEAVESQPLVLLHGHGFAITPIEEALTGKEAGDRFELKLDAGAFGVSVVAAERTVPRDRLPAGPLPTGTAVTVMDADEARTAWVLREAGANVVVTLSHPWAKATSFEAEVLSVRASTADERKTGFATQVSAPASDAVERGSQASDDVSEDDDGSADDASADDASADDASADDASADDGSADGENADDGSAARDEEE